MTEWINMENFKQKAYNVFELFDQQWALVTAGSATPNSWKRQKNVLKS